MGLNYRVGDEPVPGYRLERFLGRGAIGEVWQATGPGGTDAALKIIDLAGGGVHGQKEFRALQLVKRIHHPNLTPIMGLWAKGEDGSLLDDTDTVQIGMSQAMKDTPRVHQTMVAPVEPPGRRPTELIMAMGLGRHSLFDRLRECREQGLDGIPVAELLDYFEGAAKAIDFLNSPVHQLATGTGAIVHCDIKPLNILVVGGAAQVCDFGLAHMVGKARSTAATMGTIAYIAPETLQGAQPTPATDQYSLAISYFELRTGGLPYREETVAAVMKAVVDGDLDLSRLPKPEQAVLRKAAAPDPRNRYASASEMVAALRRAVFGEPSGERRAGVRIPGWLKIAAVLLVALVVGVLIVTRNRGPDVPPPATIEELLSQAGEHFTRGDFLAAVADYDAVLERDPQSVAALLGRGRCRLELHDLEKAIADLEQARSLKADLADVPGFLVRAYTAMAEEHLRKDELTPALADYTAVLRLEPQNVAALVGRGRTHAKLNNHEPAIADLREAIDAGHADDQLKRLLADAYYGHVQKQLDRQGWKEARKTLDEALGRVPKDARLLAQMGRALLGLGLTAEALAELDQALQIDGANAEACFLRSTIRLKSKQYAEAVADFEKVPEQVRLTTPASELRPFGDAYLALGTKLRDEKRFDEAIEQFRKGVGCDRDNPLLRSRLGTSLFRRGKFKEAAESLGEAIRCGTEDVDLDLVYRARARRVLATSLASDPAQAKAAESYVVEAQSDLLEATKRNVKNADAYFLLGEACLKLGQYDDAIRAYTQAIELHDPSKWQWCDLKEAHFFRGNCYILTDKLDEAAKEFSLLADKLGWPDLPPAAVPTALHGLAAKYAQKQQLAEAAKWNSKGIDRAPDDATKERYRKQQKLWESPKPK